MSKHLIEREKDITHGTISWAHGGKDDQYCEAGETVVIDWQPDAKWGLQEAHYTDEDGNVVPIDITTKSFTMPAKAVTVGGTFKRFVIQDWTEGIGEEKSIVEKVAELTAKVEELESAKFVELFINSTQTKANFIWPFEDTAIENVEITGYLGENQTDSNKILKDGIQIIGGGEFSTYYDLGGGLILWDGSLTELKKGILYSFKGVDLSTTNAHVYIRPRQQ